MRSSPSVAAVTAANSTTIGSPAGHDCPFQVAHPRKRRKHRGSRTLQRRNHSGDGVVEGGAAVKVGLPEFLQQLEVVVPATLIEAFAQGVGSVTAWAGAVLVTGSRARRAQHRADHLAGGVENQSVPEVARAGFIALAAFADDGGLHRLGDTVRTFVEEHLEGFCALIA